MEERVVHPKWAPVLAYNRLVDFSALWHLQAEWFEEPNRARGGWSGVSRLRLDTPDGVGAGVFLKRQENYRTRTPRHPLRGEPTFARERRNLQRFAMAGVPSQTLVCYMRRSQAGHDQAILITEELSGFVSLEDLVCKWQRHGWPGPVEQRRLIAALAEPIRRMHEHRWRHGSLYPKHLFVQCARDGTPFGHRHPESSGAHYEVRIIDLEKSKRALSTLTAGVRDLKKLNRRLLRLNSITRLRFVQAYIGSHPASGLWRFAFKTLSRLVRQGR